MLSGIVASDEGETCDGLAASTPRIGGEEAMYVPSDERGGKENNLGDREGVWGSCDVLSGAVGLVDEAIAVRVLLWFA